MQGIMIRRISRQIFCKIFAKRNFKQGPAILYSLDIGLHA